MPDRIIIPTNSNTVDKNVLSIDDVCYEYVGNTGEPVTIDQETLEFITTRAFWGNCFTCGPIEFIIVEVTFDPETGTFALLPEPGETDDDHVAGMPVMALNDGNPGDPWTGIGGNDYDLYDASPEWVAGLFGYALDMTNGFPTTSFNGNRAETDGIDFVDLHGTGGEFTYEAFVKFDSVNPSNFNNPRQILSMDNGNVQWYFVNEGGSIVMKLKNNSTTITRTMPTSGNHAINTSDWFYLVASFNASAGKIQFYWTRKPHINGDYPASLGAASSFVGHDGFTNQKFIIGNREGATENFIGKLEGVRISDVSRCPRQVLLEEPLDGQAAKFDDICGCYQFKESIFGRGDIIFASGRQPIEVFDTTNSCLNPSPEPVVSEPSSPSQSAEDEAETQSPSPEQQPFAVFAVTPSPSPGQEAGLPVITQTPTPSPDEQQSLVETSPSPSTGVVSEYVLCSSPSPQPIVESSPDSSPAASPLSRIYRLVTASPTVAETLCCDVDCGGDPSVQITVSGGTWEASDGTQGPFTPGTYCLCPSSYSDGPNNQYWTFGTNFNDDGFKFQVNAVTTFSRATLNVDYVADTNSFNTGVTGDVKDRLFGTYTAAGKTITIQRGCNW